MSNTVADLGNFILNARYLSESENNYSDVVKRVANAIGNDAEQIESFHKIMSNGMFTPGGRTLSYAGANHAIAPNCCVLDVEDDLERIFNTLNRAVELTRRGSGVGFNFSKLRPAMTSCERFGAKASGPCSFISVFSKVLKTVSQLSRHGAFIGILDINHPEITNFIHLKDDRSKITNFNLSVIIDNEWMDHLIKTPDTIIPTPHTFITYDDDFIVQDASPIDITYRELWEELIECTWSSGEPGILFKDNMNANNYLQPYFGPVVSCNPCGEIDMYPDEICNLGSINLEHFVDEQPVGTVYNSMCDLYDCVHIDELRFAAHYGTIFLNNVIDIIDVNDERIKHLMQTTRRLGLGIMGLHDMLIKLKLPYDSEQGRNIAKYVISVISDESYETSKQLVTKYGSVAQRLFDSKIVTNTAILNDIELCEVCNVTRITIAPTGSTSMIHDVSSGCEPYFSLGYNRTLNNTSVTDLVINKHLRRLVTDDSIIADIINNGISNAHVDDSLKSVLKTAQSISPSDHIRMQAVLQEVVDNSISKTINLSENATRADVEQVIAMAHKHGIKGVTVYRDNCRKNVFYSSCKNGSCDA